MHWKGHIKPGVSSALITSMDLYPTLARLAGGEVPGDRIIDGLEMLDLLLGETEESPRDTIFYYLCNNLEAVRHGDWKLHVCRRPNAGKPSEADRTKGLVEEPVKELYNLRDDPGETNNVYDQYPEIVEKLYQKIEACLGLRGRVYRDKGKNIRPIGRVEMRSP